MKIERKHTLGLLIIGVIVVAIILHYPRKVADVDVADPTQTEEDDPTQAPNPNSDQLEIEKSGLNIENPKPSHGVTSRSTEEMMKGRDLATEEANLREAQEMADPGPDPRDEEPTGTLPRKEIQTAIEKIKPFLKSCFQHSLVDFPEASGRIVVEFELESADGTTRPTQAQVLESESTLLDDRLNACLSKTIGDIEIASEVKGGGKVVVRYPFTFEPASAD